MQSGNKQYYPSFAYGERRAVEILGVTIREQFALNAPNEIPGWFKHKEMDKPQMPKPWTSYDCKLTKDQLKELQSWQYDPIYDLGDDLKFYQELWEKYWKDYSIWELNDMKEKYFQWRIYFAENLIKELNK